MPTLAVILAAGVAFYLLAGRVGRWFAPTDRARADLDAQVIRGPWQPRAVESQARENARPHGSGLVAVSTQHIPHMKERAGALERDPEFAVDYDTYRRAWDHGPEDAA